MRFCSNCGRRASDDDRFCVMCGSHLPSASAPSTLQAEAADLPFDEIERAVNDIIPGLAMHARDANLPDSIVALYKPGAIIREKAFVDATNIFMGMPTTHRYTILSNHMANLSALSDDPQVQAWGMCVARLDSHFKVLDVYEYSGKTQILLLHLPDDERWRLFSDFTLSLESDWVEGCRRRFEAKCNAPIVDAVASQSWLERLTFPVGVDNEGVLWPLDDERQDDGEELERNGDQFRIAHAEGSATSAIGAGEPDLSSNAMGFHPHRDCDSGAIAPGDGSGGCGPTGLLGEDEKSAAAGHDVEGSTRVNAPLDVEPIRPGDMLLGRYEVLVQVGEGGLCKSYLVSDTHLFGHCSLAKVLKSEKVRQDDSLESVRHMLRQEALILAALGHPGIPVIYDAQLEGAVPAIILSHYEGETLDRILSESGPCGEADVLGWMRQLCDILNYLHMQDPPIVHRDVKPSNLMLRSDGRICLIDFMCAQRLDAEGRGDAMIAYTPGYAAPEQMRGMTTVQSDLYAVGATMYELLTGALPDSARFDSIFDPSTLDVDEAVKSIVMRCVEREPAHRFQSAAELSNALAAAVDVRSSAEKPRRNGLFGRNGKKARTASFSRQEKEENQVLKQDGRSNSRDAGGAIIAGRYRVIKTLKRTDSLEISKVADARNEGETYLAKALTRNRGAWKEDARLICEEARILAKLDHPRIPHLIASSAEGNHPWLVEQYFDGFPLEGETVLSGFGSEISLCRHAIDVCDALSYLHRQDPPILHHDIKPTNIFVTREGEVCLVDFGIAMECGPEGESDAVICGTPGFAAPETLREPHRSDPRSDIYSVGATMWHMMAESSLQERFSELPLPDVRVGKEDRPWNPITDEFAEVIMKCVRTNPDDRYQTADELAAALKAVIASHGRGGMIAGC